MNRFDHYAGLAMAGLLARGMDLEDVTMMSRATRLADRLAFEVDRHRSEGASPGDPKAPRLQDRLDGIREIILEAEHRAMAVDGPVERTTLTHDEIVQIYTLAGGEKAPKFEMIDSAPKTGERVLLRLDTGLQVEGRWDDATAKWWTDQGPPHPQPRLWAPLATPTPEPEGAESKVGVETVRVLVESSVVRVPATESGLVTVAMLWALAGRSVPPRVSIVKSKQGEIELHPGAQTPLEDGMALWADRTGS